MTPIEDSDMQEANEANDLNDSESCPPTQRSPRSDPYRDRTVEVQILDRVGYYDCN